MKSRPVIASVFRTAWECVLAVPLVLCLFAPPLRAIPAQPRSTAQGLDLSQPPPPPPSDDTGRRKLTIPDKPAEPVFDPHAADKDVEVGQFYMKKGDVDAAITRYLDATTKQPNLAKPWMLLGEAYEKKREFDKALEAYKKYLQVYPTSPDRDKISKRIDALDARASAK